ncbi:unnamed protein product [Caenorhabditis brenneri]
MPTFICSDTEIESDGGGSGRKIKNKPLMEKKRRARINRSLSQLKQILIQDEHKNSTQHSKWEKADILEMTVEYLQLLRSQNCIPSPSSLTATPTNPTPSPRVKPSVASIPIAPIVPYMNPMMQQYVAYQQLAQLSMYSQLVNGQMGLTFGSNKLNSQSNIESPDSVVKSENNGF